MSKIFSLCCVLMALSAQTFAKVTVIYGNEATYAGKTLSLRTYADEIMKNEDELAEAVVDNDGNFRFEVDLNDIVQAFVPNDVSRSFIYLEPGQTYHVTIPPYTERTIAQKLDPFFDRRDCLMNIVDLRRGDFNYQMMEFEDAFDFYSMKHITYGAAPDSVEKSVADLRRIFPDLKKPFQLRFKEYRYLLLRNMAVEDGQMQDSVIHMFNRLGVDDANPAFWDCLNNVFQRFVENSVGSIDYEVFKRIIDQGNARVLFQMLEARYGITNTRLRQLVAIKIVGDLVNNPVFDKEKVIALLKALGSGISGDKDRELLEALIRKSLVNFIGLPAPDFEAYDADGKPVKISDFRGRYVYLVFGNSNLQQSARDLQVLQRFADTYKNRMVILDVLLYDDQTAVGRMQQTCRGKVTCLSTPIPDEVRRVFGVKGIPAYLLLDKEGNFLMSKGAEPNDELKLFLQNTLKP